MSPNKLSDHPRRRQVTLLSVVLDRIALPHHASFLCRPNPSPFRPDNNVEISDRNVVKINSNTTVRSETDDRNNETPWPIIHHNLQRHYKPSLKPSKIFRKFRKQLLTNHFLIPTQIKPPLIYLLEQDLKPSLPPVPSLTIHGTGLPMLSQPSLLPCAYVPGKSTGEHQLHMAS